MRITKKTTVKELAAIITDALNKHSISAVLTGGAVVSIYTKNEYESQDLDFISPSDHKRIEAAMLEIGFQAQCKNFTAKETDFSVEFPTGPLALGDREPVEADGSKKINGTTIHLLSPTQCVMDRLAWFYHNKDRQCLDQAVMVAIRHPVKFTEVEKWSKEERSEDNYQIFLDTLKFKRQKK